MYWCGFCHEDLPKRCICLQLFSGTLQGYLASAHPCQHLSQPLPQVPAPGPARRVPGPGRAGPGTQATGSGPEAPGARTRRAGCRGRARAWRAPSARLAHAWQARALARSGARAACVQAPSAASPAFQASSGYKPGKRSGPYIPQHPRPPPRSPNATLPKEYLFTQVFTSSCAVCFSCRSACVCVCALM